MNKREKKTEKRKKLIKKKERKKKDRKKYIKDVIIFGIGVYALDV